jgi:hypothetical protein
MEEALLQHLKDLERTIPKRPGAGKGRWRRNFEFSDVDGEVDLAATNYRQAGDYLRRRKLSAGSFSSFKKLSKAARILNRTSL